MKARGLPLWRRVVRAVRRQPGWAAAVAVLGVLTLLAASANHHLTGRANESAKQRGMEDAARAQTDAWRDYGVQIQAASDALAAEDPDQADAVLEQTPEAFRGWEYDWLKWRATQHHAIWASPDGQHGGLASVDLSPDGGLVASGGGNGWLWLNRMASGEILGSTNLLGRKGINSVRFSPDNQRIITASQDGTAVIVATEGLRVLHRLTGHDAPVNAACFLDDGGRCVTAGADGSVRLWDAGSGEEMIQAVPGHPPEAIHDLAPSPDGTRLAAAGHAGSLWILSATNATLLQSWSGHAGPARAVAWSPDGARLASAGSTGDVYLWEVSTRERLRALSRGSGPTYRLAWSSDGQWLAGACNEGRVLVWNVENGEQAKPLTGHDGKVSGVVFTGNSGRLISSGFDSTLRVWTLRSTAGHFQQPTEGEQRTTAIVVGNNGRLLVRGDVSGRISVHELPGLKAESSFAAHEKNVSALALSSEAQWLASASLDGTLRLWKGLRGELAAELLRGEEVVRDVCFSPDGRLLAAAGNNGTATLWNVAEAQLLRRLEPPEPSRIRVGEVLFSSDGRLLIAREARGRVGLWDVDTGSWRGFLGDPSQDGKATALALGTGTTVLVGYGHGTVTVWQVETMT
ncbi:MAG: WD40 repeat domain-containing protein, partial [Verrucomicrobiae bacterium]|nr:WD40 repeat domain-containing protein [Verrucomicrobiae bacterium]